MSKNKKLCIIGIICIVLAIGGIATAILLHKKSDSDTPQTTQTTSQSSPAAGEEYLENASYKEEYEKVSSYGIDKEPDTKIKASMFNRVKNSEQNTTLSTFNLLKVYEAFRFYDMGLQKDNQNESYILVVYTEGDRAIIFSYIPYKNAEERADQLTKCIQDLDNKYEEIAANAYKLDSSYILYE